MPSKPKALVLDAWSVIAYFDGESAGQQVADLLADAHEQGIAVFMTVVNAGEVWYLLAREVSEIEADRSIIELRQLGIEFMDADWELTQLAAKFKAKGRISYADCFAAALTKQQKAELVTGDNEFKQVESDVKIHWI